MGLSPRVWGNPTEDSSRCHFVRPIPTCVGQPPTDREFCQSVGAYPHVCGATTSCQLAAVRPTGLSPRVWGNPDPPAGTRAATRPIPTCVGQPPGGAITRECREAYPHVCGATDTGYVGLQSGWGLSPRVWGNLLAKQQAKIKERPIPTCVGQPDARQEPTDWQKAYPHVCGATCLPASQMWHHPGLSPRVWGNLASVFCDFLITGPIPTCVGQPARRLVCDNHR